MWLIWSFIGVVGAVLVILTATSWTYARKRKRAWRRWGALECLRCGYPLGGTVGPTCPECGFGAETPAPDFLRRARRITTVIEVGVFVVAVAVIASILVIMRSLGGGGP